MHKESTEYHSSDRVRLGGELPYAKTKPEVSRKAGCCTEVYLKIRHIKPENIYLSILPPQDEVHREHRIWGLQNAISTDMHYTAAKDTRVQDSDGQIFSPKEINFFSVYTLDQSQS